MAFLGVVLKGDTAFGSQVKIQPPEFLPDGSIRVHEEFQKKIIAAIIKNLESKNAG